MQENLYNLAFERSILSSIVFEPSQFDELGTQLKKDDFYLPAHQDIFSAMTLLLQKDQPIDEEFIKKLVSTIFYIIFFHKELHHSLQHRTMQYLSIHYHYELQKILLFQA